MRFASLTALFSYSDNGRGQKKNPDSNQEFRRAYLRGSDMRKIVQHDVKMDTVAEWFFVRSPVRNIEGDGLLSHYSLGARVRISSVSFFCFFGAWYVLVARESVARVRSSFLPLTRL